MSGVAAAVRELRARWRLEHHTAVHLLRIVGEVGGRTTSGRRSRLKNRLVGGARGSHHLSGRAIDHVVARSRWHHAIEFIRADRCSGDCRGPIELLDEGDHIHAAW